MSFEELSEWWSTSQWQSLSTWVILLVMVVVAVVIVLRVETVVARKTGREPIHCRFWRRGRATVVQISTTRRRASRTRHLHG